MPTGEVKRDEDILKQRYLKISKIILLLAVIYLSWIIIHILSVYFLGLGNKWAILTMDQWILSSIFVFSICLGLVFVFILHWFIAKKRRLQKEKPKPEYYKGKRLYTYTHPEEGEGGLFSKTFVPIDENTIISLRYQMIPPKELWKN